MVCRRGGRRPTSREDVGLDHATLDDLTCGRSDRLGVELVFTAGAAPDRRAHEARPGCDLRDVAATVRAGRPDLVWLITDPTCPPWHLHALAAIARRGGAQVLVVRADDDPSGDPARAAAPSARTPAG